MENKTDARSTIGMKISDFEYCDMLSLTGSKLLMSKEVKKHADRFLGLVNSTSNSDELAFEIEKDQYFSSMDIETRVNLVFNAAHLQKASDERYSINGNAGKYRDQIYLTFAENYLEPIINNVAMMNKSVKEISDLLSKKSEHKKDKEEAVQKDETLIDKLGWPFE